MDDEEDEFREANENHAEGESGVAAVFEGPVFEGIDAEYLAVSSTATKHDGIPERGAQESSNDSKDSDGENSMHGNIQSPHNFQQEINIKQ